MITSNKVFKLLIPGVLGLIVVGLILSFYVYMQVFTSCTNDEGSRCKRESKTFEIPSGSSVSTIADILVQEDIISSSFLFKLYVRLTNSPLQAGVYTLPTNSSIKEAAIALSLGKNDTALTIIEGLRSEEIAEVAAQTLSNFDKTAFITDVKKAKLEGYLYPDTYMVQKETTSNQLIKLLRNQFDAKISDLFKKNTTGLTEYQVVILASIVEREEPTDAERPKVAGILLKRLRNGEILGVDATTQYMYGTPGNWWPKEITQEQLDTDSPFNTRKNAGLPPQPISNPGFSAISAVINSEDSEYNFYLHGKDGQIRYGRTLDEHNDNIRKYLD